MPQRKKILSVFGTRPEAIKMAPVVKALEADDRFQSIVCVTGQHREMLNSMLEHFSIKPDFHLDIMQSSQGLTQSTCSILSGLEDVIGRVQPAMLLMQGDTTTAMASSLAAIYQQVPVGHVEAGLRTGNLYSPWPEEANRKISGSIATLHFAPTGAAKENLLREGVAQGNIFVTGNTVIDALNYTISEIKADTGFQQEMKKKHSFLGNDDGFLGGKSLILVTGHRRESFGQGFENICHAIQMTSTRPDVEIVYPVHLNPNVKGPVHKALGDLENVTLLEPLSYREFIFFMSCARIILTDSGGVQEEAPSLKKPVLVMRDVTERSEAVQSGAVELVGTNPGLIYDKICRLLDSTDAYESMQIAQNPYGDGQASPRIIEAIGAFLNV